MERNRIGTIAPASARDDELYLDFVEGMRLFVPGIDRAMMPLAEAALASYQARTGHPARTPAEVEEAVGHLSGVRTHQRIMRTSQEMFWRGVVETYRAREAELLAELDRTDRMGPGSVEYDPNFPVPGYARREIHLQPGGYTDDPLAGYIYHYGTKVFFLGANDNDEIQNASIQAIPAPADGRVTRALDVACSVGQSTTALKQRFADAEIWGIDVSMPMVRYAHKRAVDMGLAVHFAQRLAEGTGFPDAWFDLVYTFLLFHELPEAVRDPVVAEMARITRPGGLFVAADFPTAGRFFRTPLTQLYLYTDSVDNCEPYEWDFMLSDFVALLRRHFASVNVIDDHLGRWPFAMPFYICSNP